MAQNIYRQNYNNLLLPSGLRFPQSLEEVATEFDAQIREGRLDGYLPTPTGFSELDGWLGGGFHAYNLMLIGGPQNVGKTVWILQAARNVAIAGGAACLIEYEHDEVHMLHRLLAMESKLIAGKREGISLDDIRQSIQSRLGDNGTGFAQGLQAVLDDHPIARTAWDNIALYFDRLFIIKGHPMKTSLEVIDTYLEWFKREYGLKTILFIDYLQKIPHSLDWREVVSKSDQVAFVTEGLKDLALAHGIPIVAVTAMDAEGLKKHRGEVFDLAGGETTKYEPDAVVMLNPRWRWDDTAIRGQVVASIEKNRNGPTGVETEYFLHGKHFCFL